MKKTSPRTGIRHAFSLVEVTIAMGVASFCLLSLAGLLPVGISLNKTSVAKTNASGVVSGLMSDLRATPSGGASPAFGFSPSSSGTQTRFLRQDGTSVGSTCTGDALYRLTVQFIPPAAGQRTATLSRVLVSWPAAADADPAKWPANYSGSLETMAGLDLN